MAAEPTIRDALIAEMLGDIGKLHDAVQHLTVLLPQETDRARDKLVETIGLLDKAGDAYLQTVKTFTAVELSSIREDAIVIRGELVSDVKQTLAGIPKMIHSAVESTLSGNVREALRSEQSTRWITAGLCLASAMLGTTLTLGIFVLFR